MKNNFKTSLANDGYLMRSLMTSSQKTTRRRLKSIQFGTIQMGKGCRRYQQPKKQRESLQQKSFDKNTLQYPTFGNWKVQLKVSCQNSKDKIKSGSKDLGTAEKKKNLRRTKLYEENKIRSIAETVKLRPRALRSIENIVTRKFVQKDEQKEPEKMENEGKRKLTQRTLSSRCQALSKQLQNNFDTIEYNLKKVVNKKESFKILYLKQKYKYEEILRKHNIEEEVDDSEFRNYFHS